jgi:hypothetical protein
MESLSVGILRFAVHRAAENAYLHAKGALRRGQECSGELLRNRQRRHSSQEVAERFPPRSNRGQSNAFPPANSQVQWPQSGRRTMAV